MYAVSTLAVTNPLLSLCGFPDFSSLLPGFCYAYIYFDNILGRGARVAQSFELPTLDFGSGRHPKVVGLSPTVGSTVEPASESLSPSAPLPPSLKFKKKTIYKDLGRLYLHSLLCMV